MYKQRFRVAHLILWIIHLCICANDENLNKITNLLGNSETRCSDVSLSTANSHGPIYVHLKYPVLGKIIIISQLRENYMEEINTIEQFINLLDRYLYDVNQGIPQRMAVEFQRNLKSLLISYKQMEYRIKSVSLCLFDQFIITETTDQSSHYLCKLTSQSAIIPDIPRVINNKTYSVSWEPVSCSPTNSSVKFPLRLIYNNTNITNTSMLIFFEFDVREFRLNQCETELHRCPEETTKCVYNLFSKTFPFETGNYYCQCRSGFFMGHKNMSPKGFIGYKVEKQFLSHNENDPNNSEYSTYNCLNCKQGCEKCKDGKACSVIFDSILLRGLPLAFQSFCITLCIVTGIIVFQLRRTRVVKSSNWILLELFLLGAILIYSMIINAYFKPTELTCAIQPFLREGGFVLLYGVLYVKVYRVLCSFQSRKAQRVYVRDQDILRYLSVLVIICLGHLIGWVATSFDHNMNPFSEIRKLAANLDNIESKSCRSKYWDVISYLYEIGLLVITIYYCKCVKSAPSEYGEVRFITIAVINELIISLIVIITRITITNSVHPDYIFLIYFLHCHSTTTISVVLVIGPKLWYLYRPPIMSAGRPRLVPHSETHIIQTQQKLNGEVDLVEINLAEMDSETIRDELKRLYTQLEIYKTRAMRKDNPHVSRKRGGRKQRRFSLQHFHKKHLLPSGHDDETSKLSEDSGGNSAGEEANLTSTCTK